MNPAKKNNGFSRKPLKKSTSKAVVDNQNDSKFIKILERFKDLYANLMVGVIVFLANVFWKL